MPKAEGLSHEKRMAVNSNDSESVYSVQNETHWPDVWSMV